MRLDQTSQCASSAASAKVAVLLQLYNMDDEVENVNKNMLTETIAARLSGPCS